MPEYYAAVRKTHKIACILGADDCHTKMAQIRVRGVTYICYDSSIIRFRAKFGTDVSMSSNKHIVKEKHLQPCRNTAVQR